MPECEIIELHHDRKVDAPSGTAIRTADLIREAGGNVHEPIHSVRLPGPGRPPGGHLRRRWARRCRSATTRSPASRFMPGVLLAVRKVGDADRVAGGRAREAAGLGGAAGGWPRTGTGRLIVRVHMSHGVVRRATPSAQRAPTAPSPTPAALLGGSRRGRRPRRAMRGGPERRSSARRRTRATRPRDAPDRCRDRRRRKLEPHSPHAGDASTAALGARAAQGDGVVPGRCARS